MLTLPAALLAPNLGNTLVIPRIFEIDIYIDPADPRTADDVYVLFNEDGSEHQRRTVADDAVPGDNKLTLVFTGLRRGLNYSLLIDEGREGSYYAFYDVPLEDLIETDSDPNAAVDAEGDQPKPATYESLALEASLPEMPDGFAEIERAGSGIRERNPDEGVDDPVI